jgi:amino acid transporter
MSVLARARSRPAHRSPAGPAAAGRMSGYDLLVLAAGGVIGSGWLFTGTKLAWVPASWALGSWLIGGLLVLIITAVMVEISTKVPKTGGLIFLPLQTSGPLFATLVAAGVWIFYAANPPSESAAMVQNLAKWRNWHSLYGTDAPTLLGIALAVSFLLLITAVNLLRPRRFLLVNNVLTAFKILVPLLIVILLCCALVWPPARAGMPQIPTQKPVSSALSAVVGTGVIYAYLGFQGPLDFAGNVRGGGIGEAARLRRAVYGTVLGSILLYLALQCVIIYIRHHAPMPIHHLRPVHSPSAQPPPVYPLFAKAVVGRGWLASTITSLINLDSVLSPAGTAMVYTYVMTREVAALSRAHLTHRGLQRRQNSVLLLPAGFLRKVFGGDRLDAYRWILIVDFMISLIMLLLTGGHWDKLAEITSIVALVIFATPGVVLASLRLGEPGLFPRRRYALMAQASFSALAVVFVLAGGAVLWGMGALAVGCLLLFGLPVVAPMAPWYDARAHVREFGKLRTSTAAKLATVFGGYFGVLTLAEVARPWWPTGWAWGTAGLGLVVAASVITFRWLVRLSAAYMTENPPVLPKPLPRPARRGQAEGAVTGTSSRQPPPP